MIRKIADPALGSITSEVIGGKRGRRQLSGLKRHADPHAASPDHAAFLLDAAMEQFEPLRQRYRGRDLEAGAAARIIDQPASDDRSFRADDDLRFRGLAARGRNARKKPLRFGFDCHAPCCALPGYSILKPAIAGCARAQGKPELQPWGNLSGNLGAGNLNQNRKATMTSFSRSS